MSKNRFADTFNAVKISQKPEAAAKLEERGEAHQKGSNQQETGSNAKDGETRRRGRPNGKRSNENFRQVTAYIGTETYKKTKMKLLANDNQQEFSELVDELLNKWLKEI